jgi:hypothetical protein
VSSLQSALNRRQEGRFSAGTVIGATFMLAIRRIHIFLPLALLCYLPMSVLSYDMIWIAQSVTLASGGSFLGLMRFAAEMLMDVLCASLFITLALAQISKISGSIVTDSVSLKATLIHIIPIYICGLLVAILSWTGFIILLIPGLYIMIITWVAVPVAIADQTGPIAAIRRSDSLIRGYRWHILGLVLLFFIFTALLERIIGGFSQYFGINLLMSSARNLNSYVLGTTLMLVMNQAVFGMLTGIAAAYSFVHLRCIKEGKSGAQLADIFK